MLFAKSTSQEGEKRRRIEGANDARRAAERAAKKARRPCAGLLAGGFGSQKWVKTGEHMGASFARQKWEFPPRNMGIYPATGGFMLANLEFHQLERGFHQHFLEYHTGIYKEI